MKRLTPLALLAALSLPGCGSLRIGNTPARRIAKDMSLPGKGIDGQCLPFAQALHRRFRSAGIPSKVIVFRYESLGRMPSLFSNNAAYGLPRPQSGAHAIVAYDDGGRIYVTDNQTWMPQWVHGGDADQLARQFSGMHHRVTGAHIASPRQSRAAARANPRHKRPTRKTAKTMHSTRKSNRAIGKDTRSASKPRSLATSRTPSMKKSGKSVAKSKRSTSQRHTAATKSPRKSEATKTKGLTFRSRTVALR